MIEILTTTLEFETKGLTDIIDITDQIHNEIKSRQFSEGNVLIFGSGSTSGITTIEYEPGLLKDYPAFFEKIIPSNISYFHDETWNDANGYSHVRASLQGCSLTVPFKDGKLLLGTWQQIVLIDFDNTPRKRKLVLQITGKKVK
ncbi:MAG: secondary thiamine-phosphate synthase enzyme YjbQ [Ignavibacteriaceae bacterium]